MTTTQEPRAGWRDPATLEVMSGPHVSTEPPHNHKFSTLDILARTISEHAEAERTALEAYRRFATSNDAIVSMIGEQILKDEALHEEMTKRIFGTLSGASHVQPLPTRLPEGSMTSAQARSMAKELRQLVKSERASAAFLHKAAQTPLVGEDKLVSTLLQAMALDSRKHEQLLRFLAEHAARLAKQG